MFLFRLTPVEPTMSGKPTLLAATPRQSESSWRRITLLKTLPPKNRRSNWPSRYANFHMVFYWCLSSVQPFVPNSKLFLTLFLISTIFKRLYYNFFLGGGGEAEVLHVPPGRMGTMDRKLYYPIKFHYKTWMISSTIR